jgi:hypothetical protein
MQAFELDVVVHKKLIQMKGQISFKDIAYA